MSFGLSSIGATLEDTNTDPATNLEYLAIVLTEWSYYLACGPFVVIFGYQMYVSCRMNP